MPARPRVLLALFLLNVALQIFDGLATYLGLRAGFGEANPLIRWALLHTGPALAVTLFKLEACACLVLVWKLRRHPLALPALALTAVVYFAFSTVPWTVALASAQGRLYMAS